MKKIILIILLIFPIKVLALEYPELHYENAIVYDITDDKILYEKNIDEKKSIASLTKLMTIITAIEKAEDQTKPIVYTQEMKNKVAWYASVTGLIVGETYTFDDLLYGAMLPSGADATVALAYTTSGSLQEFINQMNSLSKEIGMTNSNFVNVHGLDEENHYSTIKDLKILLEYSLKNETFKKVYTTKEYTLSNGKKIESTIHKQGIKYKLDTSKIIGSKTGFTANAGLCISALINDENHEIIIITLGAPSNENIPYNVTDTIDLSNFIIDNYNYQTIIKKQDFKEKIKINLSKTNFYEITSTKEISLYVPKDYNKENIKIEYIGTKELSYKDKKNTQIGNINYYYDNKLLDTEEMYLTTLIEPSYKKIIQANKEKVIIVIMAIILIFVTSVLLAIIKTKHSKKNIH